MKKILKLFLFLSAALIIGCEEEIDDSSSNSNDVEFELSSLSCYGQLVAKKTYDETSYSVWFDIPCSNNTDSSVDVSLVNSPTLEAMGLSVEPTSTISLEPGSSTLRIPVYGELADTVGAVDLKFTVFTRTSAVYDVEYSTYINSEFTGKDPLSINSVDLEAYVLTSGGLTSKNGNCRLAINYTNGYGRTVKFSVSDNSSLEFADSTMTLLSGSDKGVAYVEISGGYVEGESLDISVTGFIEMGAETEIETTTSPYVTTLTTTVPTTTSLGTVAFSQMLCKDYTFDGDITIEYAFGNSETIAAGDLGIYFTYYDTAGDYVSGDTWESSDAIILDAHEGTITIPYSYAPKDLGAVKLSVQAKVDGTNIFTNATYTIYEYKINDIGVELLSGTIIAAEKQDYTLRISYGDVVPGSELILVSLAIDGLVLDSEAISQVESIKVSESNSYVDYTLNEDFVLATSAELNETLSSSSSTKLTLDATFKYGLTLLPYSYGASFDANCMIFNECVYNAMPLSNGQTWLDRNLGATQAQDNSGTLEASKTTGAPTDVQRYGYALNKYSYGDFYQFGRATGIPMMTDTNPFWNSGLAFCTTEVGYSAPTASTPYFKSSVVPSGLTDLSDWSGKSWEEGYWEEFTTFNSSSWTSTSTGGTNNPCPDGYRVPTQDELITMLVDLTGVTLESDYTFNIYDNDDQSDKFSTFLPSIASAMRLPFSGKILEDGPTVSGTIPYTQGQKGMVDVNAPNLTYQGTYMRAGTISLSGGYLCYWTCEGSESGGTALQVNNNISVTWPTEDVSVAMPVRCIKHQ